MTESKKPQPTRKTAPAEKKQKPGATAQELSQEELKKIAGGAVFAAKKGA